MRESLVLEEQGARSEDDHWRCIAGVGIPLEKRVCGNVELFPNLRDIRMRTGLDPEWLD